MGFFRKRESKGKPTGGRFAVDTKQTVDCDLQPEIAGNRPVPAKPGEAKASLVRERLLKLPSTGTVSLSVAERWCRAAPSRGRSSDIYASDLRDYLEARPDPEANVSVEELRDLFDKLGHGSKKPVPEKWESNPPIEEMHFGGPLRSRRFINDQGHPCNGPNGEPAIEEHWPNGSVREITYISSDNQPCNGPNGEPGVEKFYENGQVEIRKFYENGNLHNGPNGEPSFEKFHENGQVAERRLTERGTFNDGPDGEPAISTWDETGQIRSEEHHIHGKWLDGRDGTPHTTTWHPNGERASEVKINGGGIPGQDGYIRRWDEDGNLTRSR